MAMIIGFLDIFIAFIFFLVFRCLLLYKQTHKFCPRTGQFLGCFRVCSSKSIVSTTVDPVNIHYILSSNFVNYPKGMEFKKIFEVIEDAIFNIDSGMWEDMRNSSHAIFSRQDFQSLWVSTSVSKINQGLVPILDNAVEKNILVDLQDVFQRFLFDTSTILMTGYDLKCLSIEMPKVDFGDAVDGVSDAIFYRHVKPACGSYNIEEFRPERWISASGRLKHEPSYKFLAFNAGPRTCLGKKLTFLQMKTVAVNIIQNYEIQVVEGHKTEPVPSVLLRMQHGLKVRVAKI
ncbi:hypothetical protein Bca52824_093620 [Brassica carinata]|uniref:Cytochrome P450 n=1 Tax=Brassica carinata TaxID=52824 RepID=A0A8X7P5F1_BRACI|nr:hypothetical protein Bca52824_093620 [Brassica carinata]